MNVYVAPTPPYWWAPNPRNRRGHPTRPRRNPWVEPRPAENCRPGER